MPCAGIKLASKEHGTLFHQASARVVKSRIVVAERDCINPMLAHPRRVVYIAFFHPFLVNGI